MELNFITSVLAQKETMEFLRLGIVYAHLIACCVAIGLVLTSDIAMVKQLMSGEASDQDNIHLNSLQKTVSLALIALWVSGIAIIGLDVSSKGLEYFLNPKLQAKIAIVVLLTFNGFLLHSAVMPAMQKAGSLLKMTFNMRMLAIFSGTVSGVSWFYAAMLGVGRPLSWKYSLMEIMAAYPVLIVGGIAVMLLLTSRAQQKSNMQWSERSPVFATC